MAIGIKLRAQAAEYSPEESHFFGAPLIPSAWCNDFYDDTMFFCQIRLSDLSELDSENRFSHRGYLYVFLDTSNGKYSLSPIVRYFDGEPDVVIDDFNDAVCGYEQFTQALSVEFSLVDDDFDGMKLLGVPSDWNYETKSPELLMQIDHFDEVLSFHEEIDGFTYLFFGRDTVNFTDVSLHCEHS